MTPEEQRIAIAELCGISRKDIDVWLDWTKAERQFQSAEIETEEYYSRHLRREIPVRIPDYLNDRNALWEALRSILATSGQWVEFVGTLGRILAHTKNKKTVHEISCIVDADEVAHAIAGFLNADLPEIAEALLHTTGQWK